MPNPNKHSLTRKIIESPQKSSVHVGYFRAMRGVRSSCLDLKLPKFVHLCAEGKLAAPARGVSLMFPVRDSFPFLATNNRSLLIVA
jgi:hypothetical protein